MIVDILGFRVGGSDYRTSLPKPYVLSLVYPRHSPRHRLAILVGSGEDKPNSAEHGLGSDDYNFNVYSEPPTLM